MLKKNSIDFASISMIKLYYFSDVFFSFLIYDL
jgi:hypothetical protein